MIKVVTLPPKEPHHVCDGCVSLSVAAGLSRGFPSLVQIGRRASQHPSSIVVVHRENLAQRIFVGIHMHHPAENGRMEFAARVVAGFLRDN